MVIAGGNTDIASGLNPATATIYMFPATKNNYGAMLFGYPDALGRYRSGINDQGLYYSTVHVDPHLHANNLTTLLITPKYLLQHCSNIKEAVALLMPTLGNPDFSANGKFVADRFGNSAIIYSNKIIYKKRNYQVLTNFRQNMQADININHMRYKIAADMLRKLKNPTVQSFTKILAAIHQEKYPTQISLVCDLKRKVVYLYYFHNFLNPLKLDVTKELSKGERAVNISSFFASIYVAKIAEKEHKKQPASVIFIRYLNGVIDDNGEALATTKDFISTYKFQKRLNKLAIKYRKLKATKSPLYTFNRDDLITVGKTFLIWKSYQGAITLFRLSIKCYPKLIAGYLYLARVYVQNKEVNMAKEILLEAQRIAPNNKTVKTQLERLRAK